MFFIGLGHTPYDLPDSAISDLAKSVFDLLVATFLSRMSLDGLMHRLATSKSGRVLYLINFTVCLAMIKTKK